MAMKLVKKTDEYSVYLRSDKRYAVKDAKKQPINGAEKVRILVEEELVKAVIPSADETPAVEESEAATTEPAEETPAEETAEEDTAEEGGEESSGEDDGEK
ncbi:MAG: hypothetical protein AAGF57_00590 [Pseudomonadota bacterium]